MSAVTGKNAIANLIGSLSGPLIGLVMTPFYLRKIGLEGLGLIGLMALISAMLGVFVAGAGKTYQRDVSAAQATAREDLSGLIKGGLLLFGGLGLTLGTCVLLFGHNQIHEMAAGTRFTAAVVDRCLIIISLLLALGVLSGAISSTLVALRDQVWPSTLGIAVSIVTAVASWLALTRYPRVDVFYLCQLGGTTISICGLAARCRWVMRHNSAGISSRSIRDAWRDKIKNSGRLSFILIVHEGLGILITQIDRLLVTSHFPLASLGAYNLGANPARFAGIFTTPINTATYPELCRLASGQATRQVIGEYLGRISFIMVLLFSCGMIVLIPSAADLLAIWLGADNVPPHAATCFTLLSAGYLLLAVAGPSYNLTVAFGKVGYGIPKNVLSLLILPPLGILFIKLWGLPGVALVPVIYACNCILICGWFAYHRHGDIRSSLRWIGGGVGSLAVAGAIAYGLTNSALSGWYRLGLSCVCSTGFLLVVVIRYFGGRPKAWLHALEIHPAA